MKVRSFMTTVLQFLIFTTFDELRLIVQARRNGWMIRPGQMYVLCIQKVDGDFCVFRAIPAIDDLCHKYDLYQEW